MISDGTGGTVEAHSKADGVIKGHIAGRRWDMGILIPEIEYQALIDVPVVLPATPIFRLANPPMHGPVVKQIQTALQAKKFNPGVVDGVFGPHTQAAVVAFQISVGLTPDGEVGPATATALGINLGS